MIEKRGGKRFDCSHCSFYKDLSGMLRQNAGRAIDINFFYVTITMKLEKSGLLQTCHWLLFYTGKTLLFGRSFQIKEYTLLSVL